MVRQVSKFVVFIGFSLILSQSGFATDRVPVFVSIVPQKYFVQQIGKHLVAVQVMVPPAASPATYEPKPKQMAGISKTKLYFAIGVPFENAWLRKIAAANPRMKVVHTDQGIHKIPMAAYHHHEHGELDPHIWLSPPLVTTQAAKILSGLQEVDPIHHADYEANYKAFISEIANLDLELKTIFAGKRGLQFMVFHPAWGYFAHTYELKQVPIEIEGKDPKPAQLKELIEHARENRINVLFVQPQFSTKSAELIAREIGGQVAFADPLAEDWSANLREVANKFRAALK